MSEIPQSLAALERNVRRAATHVSLLPLIHCLERELGLDTSPGADPDARTERIHFTHPPNFAFPGGEIGAITFANEADGLSATVTTSLLGLLGTESPLPAPMSEEVLFDDDGSLQAFYDVFQHRGLSLLYRAWRRYAPVAASQVAGDDAFAGALLSLVGVDYFSPYDAAANVEPLSMLGLSDFARCDPGYIDVTGLEEILRRSFPSLALRVAPATPVHIEAEDSHRTCLGILNTTMGEDAAYGASAVDLQGLIRLVVGPVDYAAHEDLMPGGRTYDTLQRLVDHWLAERASAELEVVLSGAEAASLHLDDEAGSTLGESRYAGLTPERVHIVVPLVAEPGAMRSYHDVL